MPPSSVAHYLADIVEAIEHIREEAGTTPLEAFKRNWERQQKRHLVLYWAS
jgi:hypothetical protein